MEATIRRNGYLDLPAYLWVRLEERAKERKQDLWEYMGEALMDLEYHEPNEETRAAIMEAMNRKEYPAEELYSNADEMFKALGVR